MIVSEIKTNAPVVNDILSVLQSRNQDDNSTIFLDELMLLLDNLTEDETNDLEESEENMLSMCMNAYINTRFQSSELNLESVQRVNTETETASHQQLDTVISKRETEQNPILETEMILQNKSVANNYFKVEVPQEKQELVIESYPSDVEQKQETNIKYERNDNVEFYINIENYKDNNEKKTINTVDELNQTFNVKQVEKEEPISKTNKQKRIAYPLEESNQTLDASKENENSISRTVEQKRIAYPLKKPNQTLDASKENENSTSRTVEQKRIAYPLEEPNQTLDASKENENPTSKTIEQKSIAYTLEESSRAYSAKQAEKSKVIEKEEPIEKTIKQKETGEIKDNTIPFTIHSHNTQNSTVTETLVKENIEHITNTIIKEVAHTEIEGEKEFKLKLKPESIGEVEITLKESEGKLTALLKISNNDLREAMQIRAIDIETSLRNQGINIEKIEMGSFTSQFDTNSSLKKDDHMTGNKGLYKSGYRSKEIELEEVAPKTITYINGRINYLA